MRGPRGGGRSCNSQGSSPVVQDPFRHCRLSVLEPWMGSPAGSDPMTVQSECSAVSSVPDAALAVLAKYDRRAPRYTSYPPVPAWNRSVGPAEYADALAAAGADAAGTFSLYVHLPFCPQRCLYCGCNVTITRRRGAIEAYLARLDEELALVTSILGRGRRVVQVHLGGGTPNYLDDGELERLWHML